MLHTLQFLINQEQFFEERSKNFSEIKVSTITETAVTQWGLMTRACLHIPSQRWVLSRLDQHFGEGFYPGVLSLGVFF